MKVHVLIFITIIGVLAGILFLVSILSRNKDRRYEKPDPIWYIPALGFFLLCAIVIPLYLWTYTPENPRVISKVLEITMWVIFGISSSTWILGNIGGWFLSVAQWKR